MEIKTSSSVQPVNRNTSVSDFDKSKKLEIEPIETIRRNTQILASKQFWSNFNEDLYGSVQNNERHS